MSDVWQPIASTPRDVLLLFRGANGFYDLGFWDGLIYRSQSQGSLNFEPATWAFIPGARYDLFNLLAPFGKPKV